MRVGTLAASLLLQVSPVAGAAEGAPSPTEALSSAVEAGSGGSALAAASSLDETRVRAMIAELVPVVEAQAGRSFVEVPPLVIGSREELARVFFAEQVQLLSRGQVATLGEDEVHRAAKASADALAERFIGKYGFLDRSLYFAPDQLREALEARDIEPSLAAPIAEIVLAHELTHALQDQHVGLEGLVATRADGDGVVALSCLVEGHAVWVQERVARAIGGEAASELMTEVLGHRPVPAGMPKHAARFTASYVYGAGRDFVEWHAGAAGPERAWDLLASPPPRSSMITHPETYAAGPPPPANASVLAAVGRAAGQLAPRRWSTLDEVVGDFDLRGQLVERLSDDSLADGWRQGWRSRALGSPETSVLVELHAFADEASARKYVERMRSSARRLLADAVRAVPAALAGPPVEGSVTAFTPLSDDVSARETVTLSFGGPTQSLCTVWVARGSRVVQVVTRNHQVGDHRLARAIDRLLDAPE